MRVRTFCIGALALACPLAHAQVYQMVLDGEDNAFSVVSGWELDKTGSFNGNFKFSAPGPGDGSALAVWTIDAIPAGEYDVEFYVDYGDFAEDAQYIVEHDGGVTPITVSQNFVGTGWHALGTFNFTHAGRITQTDFWTGDGTKVIADALRITLKTPPVVPTVNVIDPEITIVVDDLGALNPNSTSTYTYQLFDEAPEFSYAIIPFLTYSTTVLQKAQTLGINTILHQPLQYIGQPDLNPSDTVRLYTGMTDTEILDTLRTNLDSVEGYVKGVNNHQGSRFSQFPHGLEVMIDELKAQGLYFLDSRTISDSYSYDISKKAGILSAERDLFVDGATVNETKALVYSVAERAKYAPNYNHIMICHQREFTVPGILDVRPDVEALGVKYVPIEHNLHYIVEVDDTPDGAAVEFDGVWTPSDADMISHECSDGVEMLLEGGAAGKATFRPDLPWPGLYRVFVGFSAGASNTDAARVTIHSNAASDTEFILNQTQSPNRWHYVGEFPFASGTAGYVEIDNSLAEPGEFVKADAVKFSYIGEAPPSGMGGTWRFY